MLYIWIGNEFIYFTRILHLALKRNDLLCWNKVITFAMKNYHPCITIIFSSWNFAPRLL